VKGLNNPTNDEVQGVVSDLASEIIEPPVSTMGIGWDPEGLNDPTNGRKLGSVNLLVSETIEPPDIGLDIVHMMEGLNNPTNGHRLGSVNSLVSEITEPPRIHSGYRSKCRRGSMIPPACVLWISNQTWLVRLLNPSLGRVVGIARPREGEGSDLRQLSTSFSVAVPDLTLIHQDL